MKLKELGTIVRKEFIYNCYCNIVTEPKEYKKITRNKMFDEIIKTYSNIKNIQDILTYKEVIFLKKSFKKTIKLKLVMTISVVNYIQKCFCFLTLILSMISFIFLKN